MRITIEPRGARHPGGPIVWFLLIAFNGVGIYLAGMALDVIPNDPSQWHVPRWIGAVAGLAFVLAGWVGAVGPARSCSRPFRIGLAATILALGVVSNWMLLHPQAPSSAAGSTASRFTGAAITIRGSLPEKYARPLMLLAWDVPMGLFVVWLVFGDRSSGKKD